MNLVDLETAARCLNLDLDVQAEKAVDLLNGAEDIVLRHIEQTVEDLADDVPFNIKAAVMVVALSLHDNPEEDPLTPAAVSLLRPHRNPGVF